MLTEGFSFCSVVEAADIIGISTGRVRQLLLRGELKGQKLGQHQWAIPQREVDRYAAIEPPAVGRPRRSEQK